MTADFAPGSGSALALKEKGLRHPCRTGIRALRSSALAHNAVRILLNELASEIGSVLEQEEVHVAYRDRTWTLKAVGEVALS